MKKLLAGYRKFSAVMETVLMAAASVALAAVVIGMFLGLLGRDVLSVGFGFLEEFSVTLLTFIAFLGMGVMLKKGLHIRADIFDAAFRTRKSKAWLALVIDLSTLAASFFIVRGALDVLFYTYQHGQKTVTEIVYPVWVGYISLAVGALFLVMWAVERIIRDIAVLASARKNQGQG